MLPLIGLIALAPLLGFVVCGLLGRRLSKAAVAAIACGLVGVSFLISVGAVLELRGLDPGIELADADADAGGHGERDGGGGSGTVYEIAYWTWLPAMPFVSPPTAMPVLAERAADADTAGPPAAVPVSRVPAGQTGATGSDGSGPPLEVSFGFRLDPLSSIMILIVTGVGFLIHVYSVGYMAHDPGFARYFAYLNLFTSMMLTLVLAGNFLVMFVGWEGVGLCSYLLIGFWYDDPEKAQAGRKAFITNRIGDFAFMVGLLGILLLFHSLDFGAVMGAIEAGGASTAALTLIGLALFVGACGKSAQIPLYVWLPDAMAGPTPVSALIHAATMVTAGVYMVARCSALFVHAPAALAVVGVVGAATALFAATIGLAQNDIKKVLAYSTVSQLGYMFLGAGVGAFAASIFHLMTHAFFKALLFLGSGSVIHAMGGEQDMRRMGGLGARLPWTFRTMWVGALAIAGIPVLAGFFSKDEILWKAWESGHTGLWAAGTLAAAFTAFYMFRLIFLTFHGSFRGTREQEHHLHESPRSMVVPLVILAVASIVGGWVGIPHLLGAPIGVPNVIERWLEPALARVAPESGSALHGGAIASGAAHGAGGAAEAALMLLAVGIAAGGLLLARRFYLGGGDLPGRAAAAAGPLYRLVAEKYRVDELYDATVLRAYYAACRLFDGFDVRVIDGLINAVAAFIEITGQVLRLFQSGFVRHYALYVFAGTALVLWLLSR